MRYFRRAVSSGIAAFLTTLGTAAAHAQGAAPAPTAPVPAAPAAPAPPPHPGTLYVVGYSHLDTEWCWSYPQVIREFLPNTLHDNFRLFGLYPDYTFNWTGSNRYRMMKEYYPEDYATLKRYIAEGRWFPAGSSIEEGDVNNPSEESIIRQVLYGNQYFRAEFGKASDEFMLPDCFGFPASLPSILAHCGLVGFSTQKLTWGSAVGIPFNVGVWQGPDGRSVVSALNAGAYDASLSGDLSVSKKWIARVDADGAKSGLYTDFRYYGAGDRGGAPTEDSVKALEASLHGPGPLKIVAGPANTMFDSITPAEAAKLPTYHGDLLLTEHSSGELTSEAAQKHWNHENELLADSAERASVAADWLGALPYDHDRLTDAWLRFLPGQFHDLLAGTALPASYTYAWNDQILALNEFDGVLREAGGGVARALDTRGKGQTVVVYNPLSIERVDVVRANGAVPASVQAVRVLGPDGREVPAQIAARDGNRCTVLFLARTPSIGWAAYDVRPSNLPAHSSELTVSATSLENRRYRVLIDTDGDISSIYDKRNRRELLRSPLRLSFQYEKPNMFPAWNMDWTDQQKPPMGYVDGPAKIDVVERGPVRVAVRIERQARGSKFIQTVRLASGEAGNRIEIENAIDWKSESCALKMIAPLTVSNPEATYNWELGTIRRGNDDPKKYEVPSHKWIDLTDAHGDYGVSILDDGKTGSDKPDDSTLRMTMLYTPGVGDAFQHQSTQDWGRHTMTYAIAGHAGDWTTHNDTQWQAWRLNQPLVAFVAPHHPGALGRSFSLASTSTSQVQIEAMKQAEPSTPAAHSREIVVRLNELAGRDAHNVTLTFPGSITSAREVDGQERTITGDAIKIVGSRLVFDMRAYRPRAFAVTLASPVAKLASPRSVPLSLPYNVDVASPGIGKTGGSFDQAGNAVPGELLPRRIVSDGIEFRLAPATQGKPDAVACAAQTIALPAGSSRRVYLLAAAESDVTAKFHLDSKSVSLPIRRWNGFVGQWDTRKWSGPQPELTYGWDLKAVDLVPGYIDRDTVAWYADHIRTAGGKDQPYQFCYLFRYAIDVPDGARTLILPKDSRIRVLAATVAADPNAQSTPAVDLYDRLYRAGGREPLIEPQAGTYQGSVPVTLDQPLYHWGTLHYTVDGSDPGPNSPVYSAPIALTQSATVRARCFDADGRSGPAAEAHYEVK